MFSYLFCFRISWYLERLRIANNSLSNTGFELFCSQPTSLTHVAADCKEDATGISEVECSCCATCCSDDDIEGCETNLPNVCESTSQLWQNERGRHYDVSRGTLCECDDGGHNMACTDTTCETCNLDRTICVVNTDYGFEFLDDGSDPATWHTTFQYSHGRNDTVYFEAYSHGPFCKAVVNGQECRDCFGTLCGDKFAMYIPICDNIEGVEAIDMCRLLDMDDSWQDSPLALFGFQEALLRQGCPLKLGPIIDRNN